MHLKPEVKFYSPDHLPSSRLIYSVITARYNDKWIFVRHHQRLTFEIPGGHIEENETPEEAAGRELMEETGAKRFTLECINTYSVTQDGKTRFGRLFFAEVYELGEIPDSSEIAEISLLEDLPETVTYQEIQPHLFRRVTGFLETKGGS